MREARAARSKIGVPEVATCMLVWFAGCKALYIAMMEWAVEVGGGRKKFSYCFETNIGISLTLPVNIFKFPAKPGVLMVYGSKGANEHNLEITPQQTGGAGCWRRMLTL